jgi:hypothetical protein
MGDRPSSATDETHPAEEHNTLDHWGAERFCWEVELPELRGF